MVRFAATLPSASPGWRGTEAPRRRFETGRSLFSALRFTVWFDLGRLFTAQPINDPLG